MATEKVQTSKVTCDRDDCGHTHYVPEGRKAPGFTGTVEQVDAEGNTSGEKEFYACRVTHVRGAIEAVTDVDEPDPAGAPPADDDSDDEGDDDTEGDAKAASDETVSALAGTQSGARPA